MSDVAKAGGIPGLCPGGPDLGGVVMEAEIWDGDLC